MQSTSSSAFIYPRMRVISSESVLCIRWPKYQSFSFSISPSNEYSGLISFRSDWFDILAVQGTLKNLLQHHSSKTPILHHSTFPKVQHLLPHMNTGKNIALTRWTFVSKVMSLIQRCCLGLSQLSFQGASIFQIHGCSVTIHSDFGGPHPKKNLSLFLIFSSSIYHEVMVLKAIILDF